MIVCTIQEFLKLSQPALSHQAGRAVFLFHDLASSLARATMPLLWRDCSSSSVRLECFVLLFFFLSCFHQSNEIDYHS